MASTYTPLGALRQKIDSSTGLSMGLVDSQGRPVLVSADVAIAAKRTVTGCGDSIMGYGDNVHAGGAGQGATSQSHVAWASAQLAGTPLHMINNRGVGGTLIDSGSNSLLNQLDSAYADNSDILWIHTGVNHLNPAIDASAPTGQQIVDKFRRILDIASPQKALIIIDAITPVNASASAPTGAAPRRAEIPGINAALATLCGQYGNVLFNDIYNALAVDQLGNANPNYFFATDGIHLTTWGAYVAGVVSALNIKAKARLAGGFRVVKPVALPDFSGTSGTKSAGTSTMSGSVATGLTLTCGQGTPIITASVAQGKQRIVIDNLAGGVNAICQLLLSSNTSYLGTLANADVVVAFARLEVASQTGLRRLNPAFQQNPGGTLVAVDMLSRSSMENANPPLPTWPPAFSGTFTSQPFALTATPASAALALTIEVAAGGTLDVNVGGYGYNAVVPT